jgi:hypothetical protein
MPGTCTPFIVDDSYEPSELPGEYFATRFPDGLDAKSQLFSMSGYDGDSMAGMTSEFNVDTLNDDS